jgi:uncharacterized membrane protein YoaK (UPF0700 family)
MVIAVVFFSLATFVGCYLPAAVVRGYELVLGRAEDIASLGALLLAFIGGAACLGCLWSKVEPPAVLVRCTLIAILLFAFTLLFLPAIAAP